MSSPRYLNMSFSVFMVSQVNLCSNNNKREYHYFVPMYNLSCWVLSVAFIRNGCYPPLRHLLALILSVLYIDVELLDIFSHMSTWTLVTRSSILPIWNGVYNWIIDVVAHIFLSSISYPAKGLNILFSLSSTRGFPLTPVPCFLHLECALFNVILEGVIIVIFIYAIYLRVILCQQFVSLSNLLVN